MNRQTTRGRQAVQLIYDQGGAHAQLRDASAGPISSWQLGSSQPIRKDFENSNRLNQCKWKVIVNRWICNVDFSFFFVWNGCWNKSKYFAVCIKSLENVMTWNHSFPHHYWHFPLQILVNIRIYLLFLPLFVVLAASRE